MTLTIEQIIEKIKKRDAYESLLWIQWYADPKRPSCLECVKAKKQFSNIPPDCSKCIPSKILIKKYFKSLEKGDK